MRASAGGALGSEALLGTVVNRKDFNELLPPELRVMAQFLKKHPKITLEQTVARLLLAEAQLAVQAPVIREARKLASSEPRYFSDEDGASHLARPSALKCAVTKMLGKRTS